MFGVCIAGLIGLAAARSQMRLAKAHQEFPVASPRVAGLAIMQNRLIAADPERQLLLLINGDDGEISTVQKLANAALSGLASSSDHLWSATKTGEVFEHNFDPDHSVRQEYDAQLRQGGPLYWDGQSLWICDFGSNSIRQYSVGDTLTLTKEFLVPGVTPAGLHVSNGQLWLIDGPSRKLMRYRVAAMLEPIDSLDLTRWLGPGAQPAGLAVNESTLWVVTDSPAVLHRFALEDLPMKASALPSE